MTINVLTSSEFRAIIRFINSCRTSTRECLVCLKKKFNHISVDTLASILHLWYRKRMMVNHPRCAQHTQEYFQSFQAAINNGEATGVILKMATVVDVSPALLGKALLEKYYENMPKTSDDAPNEKVTKAIISKQLKDTSQIENRDVAYEIYLSTLYDDQYGPISDIMQHSIGQECELRLQRLANEKNIAFFSENQLTAKDYDRTPDMKLVLPIAVDGFIINWIESKALFGDTKTHEMYLKDQYLSYWNRFGPGLVIYWFGYVDEIEGMHERKIIVRNDFPSNIILMNPQCVKAPTL